MNDPEVEQPKDDNSDADEQRIECRRCGCRHAPVLYTRPRGKGIVRKRRCRACGHVFFTTERLSGEPPESPPPEG